MKTTKSVLGKALLPAVVVIALALLTALGLVKSHLMAQPTPPATTTVCDVVGAAGDSCYGQPFPCYSTQAFWLSGLDCNTTTTGCGVGPNGGTDGFHYIFTAGANSTMPTPGTLTEFPDGHATLTGHIESTIHPGFGFNVNITYTNFTATPNSNGLLLELKPTCYAPSGPVDPTTWHFYQTVSNATLTGTGNYAGATVNLTPVMHFHQFGVGANGKNVHNGASGWFTWNVTHQPTTGACLNTNPAPGFQADFNIDCNNPHTTCTGKIGDFVWQDNNGNGCQDAGEPGIQGVSVDLFTGCGANRSANPVQTVQTDQNGAYLFSNLCAGNYTVCFHTPNGFNPTIKQSGTCASGAIGSNERDSDCSATDCNICVNLPTDSSQDLTIDCGYIPNCTGSIGDFVWMDNNGNGCQDAGEPGIQGVTVDLFSGCGATKVFLRSTATDSAGHYLFSNLCAGNYTICFHTPTGFNPTIRQSGTCASGSIGSNERDSDCSATDCNICVNLPTNNSSDLTIDCGYIPPCTGSIGDFVWNDTNQNGCQDAGEPGIPNVQVQLLSGCGSNLTLLKTTTTDSTGHYLFSGLCAGSYTVRFSTPSGFSHTVANAACNVGGQPPDSTDSDCMCTGTTSPCDVCVNLPGNNSSDLTIDCGYITTCPPCVNPNLGLGSGANFSVFQLGGGKVSITGPAGGILGMLAVGPGGSLDMSGDEFVTGTIKLAMGVSFSNSAHFTPVVQTNVDLSAQIAAAKNLSASAAALPCDQNFNKVDGSTVTTIKATHAGVNVICIKDVSISGKQVFITNPSNFANVTFILNITGQFALTGGGAGPQIRAGTNVKPADILYNLIGGNTMQVAFSGGGGGTNCCAAIVDGTLLAINRDIALSPGLVNGEVIGGKNISIVSGSSIKCPTCP